MNFLDNQVDPDTGTIRARAVFANPDHDLTPGLFVRLRLPGTAAYDGALVRDARGRHRSRQALRARRHQGPARSSTGR